MSLMTMLASAQNGNYFENVAKACGVSPALAQSGLEKLCPAIARQLKAKAENDRQAFESLLDLLDEGGDGTDLDSADAMTGAEAISDGTAVLDDIYGSGSASLAAMKKLVPGLDDGQLQALSAIAATSVLAGLSKSYAAPQALASAPAESRGLLGTIISAVVTGALQGMARQLAPKRRRRRSYASYFGRKRKVTRRRRTKTPSLNDIFGQILGKL